jgi:primosomal protein N' (replication factor Y)
VPRQPTATLPVAHVAVDVSLAHLDRPFDYLVPVDLDAATTVGCRVRVRFNGRLVDGFVLGRSAESTHPGTLAYLEKVVSPEPVLRPEVAELARAVADRYAGTLADVLRLAVPARHARAEARPAAGDGTGDGDPAAAGDDPKRDGDDPGGRDDGPGRGEDTNETGGAGRSGGDDPSGDAGGWGAYPGGVGFLAALRDGRAARAVFTAAPGEDFAARFAEAAAATVHCGRGVLALVPDQRDLDRLDAALAARLSPAAYVVLHAALGPAERYRRFLRAGRGEVLVVAGTRAAAFAPVSRLGLVAIWDDGDDSYAEPRAPYPHALQILLTRARLAGAAALVAATSRTAEAQLLLETGWARQIAAERASVRRRAPAIVPTGDDVDRERDPAAVSARLPSLAWRTARDALAARTPVLVQVPRRGYLPSVACVECHTPARCARCAGPLELRSSHAVAACRWCGKPAADYSCRACGQRRLRASVVGSRRTAEELGRAFPGTPVRTSGRDEVLARVPDTPALVVATPGAEPIADGGYGAVLLLDGWACLTRADLRAGEEALRRWLAAATLARPAERGGRVVVVADGAVPVVQALVRWDPATYAARELAERRELGFPPAARMASLTGPADAVADLIALTALPDGTDILGPVPIGEAGEDGVSLERALVRAASRAAGTALAAALRAAAGVRSARKTDSPVRIQIDPRELV